MDDGDLWGSNQSIYPTEPFPEFSAWGTYPISPDPDGDLNDYNNFAYNLLTDDNFFSQVWHKTNSGVLPFIFQPDGGSDNPHPDSFAICKFKNNSLKATQSAFNVYDISLTIEEVW